MVKNFYGDLAEARKAEHLVAEVLSKLTFEYTFEEVGDQRQYFYKGDIRAVEDCWGLDEYFLEVKDDSCIARTRNVLCEYKVFYKDSNEYGKGNMQSDYDYYFVVSQQNKMIYVINFPMLKSIYKFGKHKVIPHEDQITYCYLCSIDMLCKNGAMMYFIRYDDANGEYTPVSVEAA